MHGQPDRDGVAAPRPYGPSDEEGCAYVEESGATRPPEGRLGLLYLDRTFTEVVMTTSWVVVAHRAGARIFEHRGPGKPLLVREMFEHPQGRLKDHDVGTDRPGRSGESGSTTRHALEPREAAHVHEARVFAKTLARRLGHARTDHAYARLLLVAEPHFLGYLEHELDKPTVALVSDRIHKDLARIPDAEVGAYLDGALPLP